MAQGVYAVVDREQLTLRDPVIDSVPAETELAHLTTAEYAMLTERQIRYRPIVTFSLPAPADHGVRVRSTMYVMVDLAQADHRSNDDRRKRASKQRRCCKRRRLGSRVARRGLGWRAANARFYWARERPCHRRSNPGICGLASSIGVTRRARSGRTA
jgi:hypothetical protein